MQELMYNDVFIDLRCTVKAFVALPSNLRLRRLLKFSSDWQASCLGGWLPAWLPDLLVWRLSVVPGLSKNLDKG